MAEENKNQIIANLRETLEKNPQWNTFFGMPGQEHKGVLIFTGYLNSKRIGTNLPLRKDIINREDFILYLKREKNEDPEIESFLAVAENMPDITTDNILTFGGIFRDMGILTEDFERNITNIYDSFASEALKGSPLMETSPATAPKKAEIKGAAETALKTSKEATKDITAKITEKQESEAEAIPVGAASIEAVPAVENVPAREPLTGQKPGTEEEAAKEAKPQEELSPGAEELSPGAEELSPGPYEPEPRAAKEITEETPDINAPTGKTEFKEPVLRGAGMRPMIPESTRLTGPILEAGRGTRTRKSKFGRIGGDKKAGAGGKTAGGRSSGDRSRSPKPVQRTKDAGGQAAPERRAAQEGTREADAGRRPAPKKSGGSRYLKVAKYAGAGTLISTLFGGSDTEAAAKVFSAAGSFINAGHEIVYKILELLT